MAAKGDYARQNWYSSLGDIIKHMMRTPIFGLLGEHNFSSNHPKRLKAAPETWFWTQFQTIRQLLNTENLYRDVGKNFPHRHRGQGVLCDFIKSQQQQDIQEIKKKLLNTQKILVRIASRTPPKPKQHNLQVIIWHSTRKPTYLPNKA